MPIPASVKAALDQIAVWWQDRIPAYIEYPNANGAEGETVFTSTHKGKLSEMQEAQEYHTREARRLLEASGDEPGEEEASAIANHMMRANLACQVVNGHLRQPADQSIPFPL
jgi:hypothetical protein